MCSVTHRERYAKLVQEMSQPRQQRGYPATLARPMKIKSLVRDELSSLDLVCMYVCMYVHNRLLRVCNHQEGSLTLHAAHVISQSQYEGLAHRNEKTWLNNSLS